MVKLNTCFSKLSDNYLFLEIEKKVALAKEKRPGLSLINLGIGDVTEALPPHLLAALCSGAQEMGDKETFRGYGPSSGYDFLRDAIARHDYRNLGISVDEIFVSNGAKCDLAHIQEIFSAEARVGLCDPTYPVYSDTNAMAGRYENLTHIPCLEQHGFIPAPPNGALDLIYLCSPNNPTGVAMRRKDLRLWVDYAIEQGAVIIYDGAYEAYIASEDCPHSIYEIEGARQVAIEIRSFSKNAGFTGLRCSYAVVPKELTGWLGEKSVSLHSLWKRRHETKFGGVPYVIQRCAAAVYTPEGQKEVSGLVQIYKERSRFLLEGLKKLGYTVYGGIDAPYIWCKAPAGLTSWQFFDQMLERAGIVSIPGSGFGRLGEGFVRFSTFGPSKLLTESLLRLKQL